MYPSLVWRFEHVSIFGMVTRYIHENDIVAAGGTLKLIDNFP